jgi:prepilin-type N-terminal cleavage/methylation domain-containing protein
MNLSRRKGFMLIEILIALALFGLTAVYLVEGAFIASRTIRIMKDTRELEQDLLWARSEIFRETDYEKLKDGGDLPTISMGEIQWEANVEMTDIVDLFKVTLLLEYDGNDDLGVEAGERQYVMLMLRPTWGSHNDFSNERQQLLEEKREKIEEMEEERNRL